LDEKGLLENEEIASRLLLSGTIWLRTSSCGAAPLPPSRLPSIDCTAAALTIGIIYILILLSYYIGHKGRHGHEFLEFEISSDGKLRYANNSLYKQVLSRFLRAI
jgi:hypothetical protein